MTSRVRLWTSMKRNWPWRPPQKALELDPEYVDAPDAEMRISAISIIGARERR